MWRIVLAACLIAGLIMGVAKSLRDAPAGPSMTGATSAPSTIPAPDSAPPLTAAPLPTGWREQVSEQETPTITILNEATEASTVLFAGEGNEYRLTSDPANSASIQLPAGEYIYSLLGPYYERSGTPDQSGTFRCRKYREYTITLRVVSDGEGTTFKDLGD